MWQQGPDGRVSHPFEPLILAATLALIPVLIIEQDVSSGPSCAGTVERSHRALSLGIVPNRHERPVRPSVGSFSPELDSSAQAG